MVELSYEQARDILKYNENDRFKSKLAVEILQIAYPGAKRFLGYDIYIGNQINPEVARILEGMLPKFFDEAYLVFEQGPSQEEPSDLEEEIEDPQPLRLGLELSPISYNENSHLRPDGRIKR